MNLILNKHNTSTFDDFFFLKNFIDEDSREGYKGYKVHISQNVTDCLLNYKNNVGLGRIYCILHI